MVLSDSILSSFRFKSFFKFKLSDLNLFYFIFKFKLTKFLYLLSILQAKSAYDDGVLRVARVLLVLMTTFS